MDWTGLLAWSIDQKNGEKFDISIKPMDDETKKWLSEAMESMQVDEFKHMKEILEQISKPENQDEEQKRLNLFDQLHEILDVLDRANDFCNVGGISLMFHYFQTSKFDSIKLECLNIITSSNQNNTIVQEYCGQNGYIELFLNFLQKESQKIREALIGSISAIVRGESLNNKRRFIDNNGIQIIFNYLDTQRCQQKIANLIRDLLYYDDQLHKTYHDLGKFSNTTGLKNQEKSYSLTQDINEELQQNNELPQNSKYKGIVKNQLIQLNFLNLFKVFLSSTEYKNSDIRITFLHCAEQLQKIQKNQEFIQGLKQHLIKIKEQETIDEIEIQLIESLF